MRRRKRSSCASGSGYVPSYSIGFWVASTRNGRTSGRVTPSVVTWRSCIASSSAACVFGGARLISSARRRWVKIGPARNSKSPLAWFQIDEPVTSAGRRSGVNCTLLKPSPQASANVRAVSVLARPGTSSSSTWPSPRTPSSTSSSCSRLPTTARSTSSTRRCPSSASSRISTTRPRAR